ncbi:PREDICTED: ral-GDS-related protein-like [Galeopterus variegatus]|uniref:Ral-GDS-related protein-like n=1 Tax=Galeopterus variegatus TaxID=482537 RepID=A0ABM0Q093_GALVR|nr:PREDICTED: ral-GDS-related protein-like [Galeopterus variegatus]
MSNLPTNLPGALVLSSQVHIGGCPVPSENPCECKGEAHKGLYLSCLMASTICHTVVTMPERFCTDFHQPLHFPSLKVKIDHVQVSRPGLDTGALVYVLLTNLRHPELFEAETDASVPAPVPGEEPPHVRGLKLEEPSKPLCPSPVATMNRPRVDTWDIRAFPPKLLAEQLTLMDMELFREVAPYDCLGSIWSQRTKKGKEHLAPTVRATVAQFNNVANCVITTCLGDYSMKAQDRARVLEHWIKVARECLVLRNFSSVHAILSALQSTPIHRMRRTWRKVSSDGSRAVQEGRGAAEAAGVHFAHCSILSARGFLQAMGTVKLATLEMNHQRAQMRQRQQKKGIVPFLGTYLSDLVMLDAAMDDYVDLQALLPAGAPLPLGRRHPQGEEEQAQGSQTAATAFPAPPPTSPVTGAS